MTRKSIKRLNRDFRREKAGINEQTNKRDEIIRKQRAVIEALENDVQVLMSEVDRLKKQHATNEAQREAAQN